MCYMPRYDKCILRIFFGVLFERCRFLLIYYYFIYIIYTLILNVQISRGQEWNLNFTYKPVYNPFYSD